MRVFKYWRLAESTALIEGVEKPISCFGGSNHSEMDAFSDGQRRLEAAKRSIAGLEKRRGADYEGDIREEPLKWIGDRDVVTRNRFGAEVLNTSSCVFVDIDKPFFHLWQLVRPVRTMEQRKRAILDMVAKRLKKPDLGGFAIRIYETHSGVRLLLEGPPVDPRSKESRTLLRSFHADSLYALLCSKQNCYRARLTPKPHRIKLKSIRLKYPYEDGQQKQLAEWVKEYDWKSKGFATCRLVQVIGGAPESQVVRYHDERTRAASQLPLA